MAERLVLRRPDDWHVHLRDGEMLAAVASFTARRFARAIVMPNLVDPVTTSAAAEAYRTRIMSAVGDADFTPLMTAYLTDASDPDDLVRGYEEGIWVAAKLYPANATTNSAHGVTDIRNSRPALEAMQRAGMKLLVHGEVTDPGVDIFDREKVFVERVLAPMVRDFPELSIVLEHVTTEEGVAFVYDGGPRLAATITPHHLIINRNALFQGGLRPHAYCLPVAKRERHRLAVRRAATSGSARFFLGTDSAPHPARAHESACGRAGIFNAPFAIETYAKVFEEEGALDRLEAFASLNGPAFYGLAPNEARITLERAPSEIPERIGAGVGALVPFLAGETLGWRLADAGSSAA